MGGLGSSGGHHSANVVLNYFGYAYHGGGNTGGISSHHWSNHLASSLCRIFNCVERFQHFHYLTQNIVQSLSLNSVLL
jgi:hypothetical protein